MLYCYNILWLESLALTLVPSVGNYLTNYWNLPAIDDWCTALGLLNFCCHGYGARIRHSDRRDRNLLIKFSVAFFIPNVT